MARLVLCGEGPTDFGNESEYGPLALVVFKTLEHMAEEEVLEYRMPETVCIYHHHVNRSKDSNRPIGRHMSYGPRNQGHLRDKAEAFAANYVTHDEIGIFHSDVDFKNRECGKNCYNDVLSAIRKGFFLANKSDCCCALVPMPRTEAWLLYLTPENKFSAQDIERLPGNDKSPQAPKTTLSRRGYVSEKSYSKKNRDQTLNSIVDLYFDFAKLLKLPSFSDFQSNFAELDWKSLLTP